MLWIEILTCVIAKIEVIMLVRGHIRLNIVLILVPSLETSLSNVEIQIIDTPWCYLTFMNYVLVTVLWNECLGHGIAKDIINIMNLHLILSYFCQCQSVVANSKSNK